MATTNLPKVERAIIPTTALAFLRIRASESYLLAGEGQFVKVFGNHGRKLIRTERVFDSQVIHGISCESSAQGAGESGVLLIWGGLSIRLVSIETDLHVDGTPSVKVRHLMSEVLWDDWILDACFLPAADANDSGAGSHAIDIVLVTAHNELIALGPVTENAEMGGELSLYRIASGPSSMLYSAHVLWTDAARRLLVAAGTVFGEVLLWSCGFDSSEFSEVFVHYQFTGHEGSVFGVRISDVAPSGDAKRVLASCSDDRTIRIWEISDTCNIEESEPVRGGYLEAGGQKNTGEAESTACLAMAMGHASRIWGLRFLMQKDGVWDLISYGEDSTTQTWRVSPVLDEGKTDSTRHDYAYQLSLQDTYLYHSGKNVWAMATSRRADEECIVATGGADGRIATYHPHLHGLPGRTSAWTNQYTMGEVVKTLSAMSNETGLAEARKVKSSTESIFDSLKGSWRLSRNLDSTVSTYPSGTLEGTAAFAERPPTENGYETEYLYSESGDFATQQGLTMKATRQYVYRYSRARDSISVWFVKPDDGSTVDYFFHQLDFREASFDSGSGVEPCSAHGYHLCVDDNYNASYSFQLKDLKAIQWHTTFDVDGPKKGYIAKATYTRDQEGDLESTVSKNMVAPLINDDRDAIDNLNGRNKPDAFKTYTWIGDNEFLTTTEQGSLLLGTLLSKTESSKVDGLRNTIWEHVGHQTSLISSSVAASIPSLGIAFLTGTDGTILLYNRRSKKIVTMGKLSGKAGFLKAQILSERWNASSETSDRRQMAGVFATSLGSSRATVLMFSPVIRAGDQSTEDILGSSGVHEFCLTLPSKFTVTSSCFFDAKTRIIVGSRNGDVAIYDLPHTTPGLALNVNPSCFHNIHDEDAITIIQMVPHDRSKPLDRTTIITAGRDGKWAIHHVFDTLENNNHFVTIETIHTGVPPFGPNIEGACIDPESKDLLLWGFRSKHFVVWNESQKIEFMVIDCGGAHRNWAYTHNPDGSGGGSFVYTKASVCHVHSQTKPSHQVIQHGGHGREIKAIAVSPAINSDSSSDLRFLATGAEDTTIRIFDLTANLNCLTIITKHTTGIQQLRWSSNGHLLFSAAGCEEFFVWRVQSAPLVTIGVVCEARCPTVTEEVDLRIMDFAFEEVYSVHNPDDVGYEPDYLLSIVYSDSSVRIFNYHTSPTSQRTFQLLSAGTYTTYCLTQAIHLRLGDTLAGLCTASTDGHLAFWPLPTPFSRLDAQHSSTIHPLHCTSRTPAIHHNSIKALQHVALTPSDTLIITAGDDSAIAFTRVRIPDPSGSSLTFHPTTTTLLLPNATRAP